MSGYDERFDFRMAFDFVGKEMGVEHNSAQNFLREEFQGHGTNQACYKSGIISPGYRPSVKGFISSSSPN